MTILGIDGGGTKTTFLLVDHTDREIARLEAGPSNWLSVGRETAEQSLTSGIRNLVTRVDVVCGGFAGAGRPEGREFYTRTLAMLLPDSRVVVEPDAWTAYAGAIGLKPGVLLIAGTGSIAVGRHADGSMIRVGGWGPQFGDKGSGYWIGLEAIRQALSLMDRGTDGGFTQSIAEALGLTSIEQVIFAWENHRIGVPEIASLFPKVVSLYPREPAAGILRDAARALKELLETATARIGPLSGVTSYAGSVASHPLVRELIGVPFETPELPPEWGAIRWARSVL